MTLRLAVADENQHPLHDELISAVVAAARDEGMVCERLRDPRRESDFDVLLMMGFPQYYPSFARASISVHTIVWFGEPLPRNGAGIPARLLRALPSARLLDAVYDTFGRAVADNRRDRVLRWRERAAVEREWGSNLKSLADAHGWVDEVVVTSPGRVRGAELAGWQSRCVPFGYHEVMCGPIVPPSVGNRDIDVLLLGRDVEARSYRARSVRDVQRRLGDRYEMQVVQGGVYGEERSKLLARARVVLDLHRLPGNSSGIRSIMATAAGAAVVTEDADDPPIADGTRLVTSAAGPELAGTTIGFLDDEDHRRQIVMAAQRALTTELSMAACLQQVLGPIATATAA